ncbi:MAG: hypothetical protein K8T26_11345 [Lentisphaerae bacterium]|nr:hypothetical protein [Lentisphaerota bacterium]
MRRATSHTCVQTEFTSFEPLEALRPIAGANVLFCPSCGTNVNRWLDCDADAFVLADFAPTTETEGDEFWKRLSRRLPGVSLIESTPGTRAFRFKDKLGVLLFLDNNEVLDHVRRYASTISHFIGVCDGCLEGGNYECVNDLPFLGRVLSCMPSRGMVYMTDHSKYLFPSSTPWDDDPPKPRDEYILGRYLISRTDAAWGGAGGYGPVACYRVAEGGQAQRQNSYQRLPASTATDLS